MNIFVLDVSKSLAISLVREIFAFIDFIVYSLISVLFRTMFLLSNFELVGLYDVLLDRVYVILGIFMLFKVTISMLTYLVNPDKINDKEQGATKLITRIITVLVMLILLPNAFSLMTEVQNKLIPVVPKIVIGAAFKNPEKGTQAATIGEQMAVTMLNGFIHVKEGCEVDSFGDVNQMNELSRLITDINHECKQDGDTIYAYDYLLIVSTIVGVIMCYVIISLCISVAIRAFKLIILRMLAPIPVVSYIDPKSSKDGMFATWTKTFLSTWAELFVYLGLIYFIVYIIDFLLSADAWKGFFSGFAGTDSIWSGILFLAFILIGLLFFARQAPKFVFDALGIKSKGNFVRMLGMGAAALGMGGAIGSQFRARNQYDQEHGKGSHRLRNFGSSLLGGLATGSAAGNALLSADHPTLGTGYDAIQKNQARDLNRIAKGSTGLGRLTSRGRMLLMGETNSDRYKKRREALKTVLDDAKNLKSTIESRFDGNEEYEFQYGDHKFNWLNFDKNFQAANNGDQSALDWLANHGFSKTVTEEVEGTETYDEEVDVRVDDDGVMMDENGAMVPAYHMEKRTVTKTRPVTKTVTKTVADMDKLRSEYETIHKKGYASFAHDVLQKTGVAGSQDSVVYGAFQQLDIDRQGVTIDAYDKYGIKDPDADPIDLASIDFSEYGAGLKATIGNLSGTIRDFENNEDVRGALADDSETKKG